MRLVAGLMLFLLLSAGLLIVNLYETYCGDVFTQELKRLLTIARANSSNVQLYLNERIGRLRVIGADPRVPQAIAQADPLDAQLLARHYTELDDSLDALYLIDATGECRAASLRFPRTQSWAEQDVLANIPLDADGIVHVFPTDEARWAIVLASGLISQGQRDGTVACVVTIDAIFDEQLKYVRVGSNGYVTIQDMDGTLLHHPNAAWVGTNVLELVEERTDKFAYLVQSQYRKERGKAIYSDALPLENEVSGRMKLQAYCRANIGTHFFVLSAVLDCDEAIAVTRSNLMKAQLLLLFSAVILGSCIALLLHMRAKQQKLLVEAKYLAEMNTMLRELNSSNEQIRHFQKMQTLGTFTSGIAHELRNLLTPMLGYSEILMQHEREDPVALDNATEIHIAALRAQDMIEQLLLFGRRDKDKHSTLDICDMLCASVKMVRMMLPDNVTLQCTLRDDCAYILGSKGQLHQCIINLCKNAYQAMEGQGGTLRLRECSWSATMLRSGPYADAQMEEAVEITVSDDGPGMDSETLDQVFDPFFTTKKGVEGTGLGLSLVRDFVTRHGGQIYARSEVGKGSSFTILLPKALRTNTAQDETHTQPLFLLVCENLREGDELARKIGRHRECSEVYADPKRALEALRTHPARYCLLVTDYALQGMTGNTMAHAARGIRNDLPIIMLTNLVKKDMLWLNMDGCIDQILTKPIPFETLWACIQSLLGRGPIQP